MASIKILLRECRTTSPGGRIPRESVQTYQKLENLAFTLFNKDPQSWRLYFHLEDGECEDKVIAFIWDSGDYLNDSCVIAGKLHLFAHFEHTSTASAPASNPTTTAHASTTDTASLAVPRHQQNTLLSGPPPSLGGPSVESHRSKGSTHGVTLAADLAQSEKRSRTQAFPSESGPGSGSTASSTVIPVLPEDATLESHRNDLRTFTEHNAPLGEYGHREDWKFISGQYHVKIAHGRLIHGKYGITSPVSCTRCEKRGLECRVYHPDIYPSRAAYGACGICRLISISCDISCLERAHATAKKKRRTIAAESSTTTEEMYVLPSEECDSAAEPSNSRTSRRRASVDCGNMSSSALEEERTDLRCPVDGCTTRGATVGFIREGNLHAHIRHFHPNSPQAKELAASTLTPVPKATEKDIGNDRTVVRSNVARSGIAKGRTQYFCPLADRGECEFTHGIWPWLNFERHAESKHPNLLYEKPGVEMPYEKGVSRALATETPVNTDGPGKANSGPSVPADDSYGSLAQDLSLASRQNAQEGEFGHRSDAVWNSLQERGRQRIAHARMIQGRYGIVAANPCSRCQRIGLECRIYRPELSRGQAKMPLGRCGECRNLGNNPCDVSAQPVQNDASTQDRGEPRSTPNQRHAERPAATRETISTGKATARKNTVVKSTLLCPVRKCTSQAFTRFDIFRSHIRTVHPTSNHALVLDAVAENRPLVLNPAPPQEEFLADHNVYRTENADPGTFGHREPWIWDDVEQGTRNRIATARLIHNKYGVLAPKPCDLCRREGIACLVLHPDLRNSIPLLGPACSECKVRSVTCSIRRMGWNVFDPYLNRASVPQQEAMDNGNNTATRDVSQRATPEDNANATHGNPNSGAVHNGRENNGVAHECDKGDRDSDISVVGLGSPIVSDDDDTDIDDESFQTFVRLSRNATNHAGSVSGNLDAVPTPSNTTQGATASLDKPELRARRTVHRVAMSLEPEDLGAPGPSGEQNSHNH